MRKISAILVFILLLILIYFKFIQGFDGSSLEKVELEIPDSVQLDTSRAYLMPDSKTLSYTLSQSPRKIWLAPAAIFAGNDNKTARYPYELEVTVLDKDQQSLFSRQFHFQSGAAKLVELKNGGHILPEVFLASLQNKLGASGSVHIKLPAGATRLIIKQSVKSPQLKNISIRAYQYVQRSSRVEPVALWERLSLKQRHQLTENFPFDETFISDEERGNLVEFRWQPLVPMGDENDDYQSVVLYRIPAENIAHKKHLLSQYEHQADAYKRISFPIETKGRYRLEGNHVFKQRPFTIYMSWFNRNDSWSKTREFSFNDTVFSAELELDPGLVTFTTSIPVSLDLFAQTGYLEEHDHFSQAMLLQPGQEITYTIEHSDDAGTPLQIKGRAFAEQDISTEGEATIRVTEIGREKELNTTEILVESLPEENSQLVHEEFYHWLGAANRRYLNVSSEVQKIRLTSDQPVLISVHTRLSSMPAIRVLPEEKRDWFDYPSGVPDWFSVRPDNQAALINQGNVRLLKHYHHSLLAERDLPEPDETYQSLIQDFDNLTLLDLMVENPYPGQPTTLEENTDLNYAPVSLTLSVESERGSTKSNEAVMQKPPSRRLFFVKQDDSPQQIDWSREQQKQPFFWVAGKWGIVDELATGSRIDGELSFGGDHDADGVRWWRNGVSRQHARWQQRRALLLQSGQKITVSATKSEPKEIISIVAYTIDDTPIVLELKVTGLKRDPNVASVHTIVNRRYQIQPAERYRGFQLSGAREIRGRQSFSLVLDEDLMPGDYQITLAQLQGKEAFVSMVKRTVKPAPVIERYRTQGEH